MTDLNLPLTGIAFVFTLFFLRVKTPEGSTKSKLLRIDWLYVRHSYFYHLPTTFPSIFTRIYTLFHTFLLPPPRIYTYAYTNPPSSGNAIFILGSTLTMIALTFAGSKFPWNSPQVLAPLIVGLILLPVFLVYEAFVPTYPTIPWNIVSNRTSASAYFATFFHGICTISIVCEFFLSFSLFFFFLVSAAFLRSPALPPLSLPLPFALLNIHANHTHSHRLSTRILPRSALGFSSTFGCRFTPYVVNRGAFCTGGECIG